MKDSLKTLFADGTEQDQRSANMIYRAIEKNNQKGFDYIEFRASIDGLAKLNMDEPTRYQSAFVTAATLGLTKAKLIKTATFYRDVVVKEKAQFDRALQQQMTTGVAKLEHEIEKLQEAIKAKEAQIEKLRSDIEKHQAKQTAVQQKIDTTDDKIQATQVGFENAYEKILAYIDADIANIEQYLD